MQVVDIHMQTQSAPGQLAAALGPCLHQLLLEGSHLQTLLSIAHHVTAATRNDSEITAQAQVSSCLLGALQEAVQQGSSSQLGSGLAAVVGCLEAPGLAAEHAAFLASLRSSAWAALEAAAAAEAEPDGQLLSLMAQVSSGTTQSRCVCTLE